MVFRSASHSVPSPCPTKGKKPGRPEVYLKIYVKPLQRERNAKQKLQQKKNNIAGVLKTSSCFLAAPGNTLFLCLRSRRCLQQRNINRGAPAEARSIT
jgi:hypothetical protein